MHVNFENDSRKCRGAQHGFYMFSLGKFGKHKYKKSENVFSHGNSQSRFKFFLFRQLFRCKRYQQFFDRITVLRKINSPAEWNYPAGTVSVRVKRRKSSEEIQV